MTSQKQISTELKILTGDLFGSVILNAESLDTISLSKELFDNLICFLRGEGDSSYNVPIVLSFPRINFLQLVILSYLGRHVAADMVNLSSMQQHFVAVNAIALTTFPNPNRLIDTTGDHKRSSFVEV
jgi:hypothetical protein